MVWRDQDSPATDVLVDFTVPFSGGIVGLELDKLRNSQYRVAAMAGISQLQILISSEIPW